MAALSPDLWVAGEPSIDVDVEPWLARFPGLGSVTVAADGSTEITAEPVVGEVDPDDVERRERSLRFGWAEPLSFARRGYSCVLGAAFQPVAGAGCVVFAGGPPETVGLVAEFSRRGWLLLAEGLVPMRWQGDRLLVHAREAPALASSRHATEEGFPGTSIRSSTDSCEVAVARGVGSSRVAAVVAFQPRKFGDMPFEVLLGQLKFQAAARLFNGGVLDPDGGREAEPATELSTHLRLAALPFARLTVTRRGLPEDLEAVIDWLPELVVLGAE